MTTPTTPRRAPAVPAHAPGVPDRYIPFLSVLDSLAQAQATCIQSRSFPDDPLRTAYIVTGPSAEAVQLAIADIMESIGNGQADFTMPYRAGLSWECKGITERPP